MADGNFEEYQGQKIADSIYHGADGSYRWAYEFDMLKNPAILITTMKVLLLSFGIVMAFMLIVQLIDSTLDSLSEYLGFFGPFFILLGVFMVLGVIAYLIVAASYGWKYMVLFTMDENQIEHRQMKSQFNRASAMGWVTAAAGILAGRPGTAGAGVLAATRSASTSVLENVRVIKAVRGRNTIYVNQLLEHNQIYADGADFDFVLDFLIKHCPNAKVR